MKTAPDPPFFFCVLAASSVLLKVTSVLVVGAGAVVDVTTPSSARTFEGCGVSVAHSHALPLMCMSAGHTSSGHVIGEIGITLNTPTPLAGFLTFTRVLEVARGDRAQQQRVRCWALDARDPSTIIPNHHPHTAHVACTPKHLH